MAAHDTLFPFLVGAVIFKVKEFFMEDSRVCFLYDILLDLAIFLVVSITRVGFLRWWI